MVMILNKKKKKKKKNFRIIVLGKKYENKKKSLKISYIIIIFYMILNFKLHIIFIFLYFNICYAWCLVYVSGLEDRRLFLPQRF